MRCGHEHSRLFRRSDDHDANGVMRKRCVKIAFEGGCSCDSVKLTTKGLCMYYK